MELVITRKELTELLAACNNCIMNGSYSGDAMIEAVELMHTLTELHEVLSEGVKHE